QQLDAKFRKFIKVLIMQQIQNFGFEPPIQELFEKEQKENINGYIEIGNEIFKITSFQDIRNIINRFDSDN
ncbi:hypothetical protein PQG92_10730, partial [Phocaeicola dorei]|nr:hypothetical protein [Phocaeicola dorei]